MVALNETVTIINKSGKIVSSSKHLVNVFNEAKNAYNERRAELKALRRSQAGLKDDESKTRQKLENFNIDDDARSRRSSRRNSEDDRSDRPRTKHRQRPPVERGVSDSFYTTDRPSPSRRRSPSTRTSHLRHENSPEPDEVASRLVRRHTDGLELDHHPHRSSRAVVARRASLDDIDMDLAYGELPPPLPARKYNDETALRSKMSSLQVLLDECNCLQHSVTAIIDNLQKNPDALAAVALTLAEISNLVAKVAPGALAGMKGSFPAVVALLASPEFAIAAGVGVGVTIIALGGYKIIKKIQARRDAFAEDDMVGQERGYVVPPPSEQQEELRELDRIEMWRRGIADVEAESLGSSVDGELITPGASRTLMEQGRLTEADFKSRDGSESGRRRKGSKKGGESSRTSRSSKHGNSKTKSSAKEPSGLRMLFKRSP